MRGADEYGQPQRSASYWESLGTAEVLTLTVGENEYVLTADKLGELKTTAVKARNPLSDLGRNGFVAAFTGVSLPEILASVGYADAQIVSVTVTDKDGAETKIEGRSIEKAVFALAFDGRVLKDAELAALIPPAAEQGAERVAIMRAVKLTVVLAEDGAEGGE